MPSLELKIPPLVVVIGTACAMWGLSASLAFLAFAFPGSSLLAALFAITGAFMTVAGVVTFRRRRTPLNPLEPSSAETVVCKGVYRFSRNPMYLGMLLVLAGFALYLSNVASTALLPVFVAYMNQYQIKPEERALAK